MAQGPTTGTTLAPVPTTIPTDPFTSQRPPGAREWGIQTMTPLAAPSFIIGSTPVVYQVALPAGDQLEIGVADANKGTLSFQAQSDLG